MYYGIGRGTRKKDKEAADKTTTMRDRQATTDRQIDQRQGGSDNDRDDDDKPDDANVVKSLPQLHKTKQKALISKLSSGTAAFA